MKLKFTFLLLLIFLPVIIVSCTCPADLDTRQYKEPTDFAKVMFINAMPDLDSVDICSVDEIISRNNLYDSASVEYKKIVSGITSIRIQSNKDSSIYYNSMIELLKDSLYTFFAYGSKNRTNGLLLRDKLVDFIPTNAYARFIHLSPDAPSIEFTIGNIRGNKPIQYKSHIDFIPIPAGEFNLIVNESGTGVEITKVENYNFKAGKLYDLVLKGYFNQNSPRRLRCDIIEFNHE